MNSWTHENPHTSSRLLCVNLLEQTQNSEASSRCPGGITVEIDVTDSEAKLPVANSSVEVLRAQAPLETEVIQGLTDEQGRIKLDLQQPGSYLVQVALTIDLSQKELLPGGGRRVLWRAEAIGG